jgi:hypothetical protein
MGAMLQIHRAKEGRMSKVFCSAITSLDRYAAYQIAAPDEEVHDVAVAVMVGARSYHETQSQVWLAAWSLSCQLDRSVGVGLS